MITQREISRKAFQARKQDRVVEKDYVVTWLLLGISDSTLRNILAFKGGTALKKAYFEDYRFSEDLDFTVLSNLEVDRLLELLSEVFSSLAGEVALMFRTDDRKIEARADSLSLYVDFVGPLQGALGSRNIKLDFTYSEDLVYPLKQRVISAHYSDCDDVSRSLNVYSLEEVLVEKLCALIGRTEPRDLYDVHFLLGSGGLDYQSIAQGFKSKAASKNVDPGRLSQVLRERESTLARLWETRLALQVEPLPHFSQVLRETKRALKKTGIE